MQQTTKTSERRNRIAAQNAAISRRGMPPVTYPVDHPDRYQGPPFNPGRSLSNTRLRTLGPIPVSEPLRLPERALLARMCRQGRWDALQAAMWIYRHLLALIPDAGDLDADPLDAKYREMTAAIVDCGSVTEIRAALNIGR